MSQLSRFGNFKRIKDIQDKEFLKSERGLTEDDVDFLIAEVERLREALEYYADHESYTRSEDDIMTGYPPEVMNDRGYKAKSALEETK